MCRLHLLTLIFSLQQIGHVSVYKTTLQAIMYCYTRTDLRKPEFLIMPLESTYPITIGSNVSRNILNVSDFSNYKKISSTRHQPNFHQTNMKLYRINFPPFRIMRRSEESKYAFKNLYNCELLCGRTTFPLLLSH